MTAVGADTWIYFTIASHKLFYKLASEESHLYSLTMLTEVYNQIPYYWGTAFSQSPV